jgi:hypothetical protein
MKVMQLKSILTSHGAAYLIDVTTPTASLDGLHHIGIPTGWGAVLWGRSDRSSILTVALNLTGASWIADYSPNKLAAIVVWSDNLDLPIGTEITFDSTLARDAICPNCGSTNYVLAGAGRYRCKTCQKVWKPNPSPRGGARVGAGRKNN